MPRTIDSSNAAEESRLRRIGATIAESGLETLDESDLDFLLGHVDAEYRMRLDSGQALTRGYTVTPNLDYIDDIPF